MRVAVTIWENRISPVADSAREMLVVDIAGGSIVRRRRERFADDSLFHRAERLSELCIGIFICGAISDFYSSLVEGYGIQLIPFAHGGVDEVLNHFLTGSPGRPSISHERPSARRMREDTEVG